MSEMSDNVETLAREVIKASETASKQLEAIVRPRTASVIANDPPTYLCELKKSDDIRFAADAAYLALAANAAPVLARAVLELFALAIRQEDQLNRILQPGERWLELAEAYRQSDEKTVWLSGYADELDLARMRLQEALRAVLKEMVKR